MAGIAVDTSADLGSTTGTSLTVSYTNAGNIIFVYVVGQAGGATNITGATYGGVTMSQVGTGLNAPSGNWNHLFFLVNPPTGANNIVISGSPSAFIEGLAVSYTGAGRGIDVSTTNTGSGVGLLATSVTSLVDKDWFLATAQASQNVSAGASTTLRQISGGFGGIGIFDSNGALTPPGAFTANINLGASGGIGVIMVAFSPTAQGGLLLSEI